MSKQEDIREGLLKIATDSDSVNRTWYEQVDKILEYLSSQGVVITRHGFFSDLMEPLVSDIRDA